MLSKKDLEEINEYWAKDLNCSINEIADEKNKLHIENTSKNEIFIFQKGNKYIIECPKIYADKFEDLFESNKADMLSEDTLRSVFQNKVEKIVGPAYIGYTDKKLFRPVTNNLAFMLKQEQMHLLKDLKTETTELEWQHSGIEFNHYPIFVCIEANKIVAATSYEIWNKRIAHIGVVTSSGYRNKGYGRQVVSAITQYCLDNCFIAQYRTLKSNISSISVANFLGFEEYASSMFVRLF